MDFLKRAQWTRKRSRRGKREGNIPILFGTGSQVDDKSLTGHAYWYTNRRVSIGQSYEISLQKGWGRIQTWGIVCKFLTLGWCAILAPAHSTPPSSVSIIFIAHLPVYSTNMHWEPVWSQWLTLGESRGLKLIQWRPCKPGRLIQCLSSLTQRDIWHPCFQQPPREHTRQRSPHSALKVPFPLLGGVGRAASMHMQKSFRPRQ